MCMEHCKDCDDGESCTKCALGYTLGNEECYETNQYVLDRIAEQITQDSETTCTAPDLSSCESSCSGTGCTFNVGVENGAVTSLFVYVY